MSWKVEVVLPGDRPEEDVARAIAREVHHVLTETGFQLDDARPEKRPLTALRECDGCSVQHRPKRQGRPGERSFCDQCRAEGVPVRLAGRDLRERRRRQAERAV